MARPINLGYSLVTKAYFFLPLPSAADPPIILDSPWEKWRNVLYYPRFNSSKCYLPIPLSIHGARHLKEKVGAPFEKKVIPRSFPLHCFIRWGWILICPTLPLRLYSAIEPSHSVGSY